MNTTATKLCSLGFVFLAGSSLLAEAEGVFRADLGQQVAENVWLFGGVGYFKIGSESGQFEIAVVDPFGGTFTPTIYSPAGSLAFSLGSGEPRIYSGCDPFSYNPFLPPPPFDPSNPPVFTCPAFMTGTHYIGSFASRPEVLSDLLVGRGELRLLSDSGVLLTGSMGLVLEIGPVLTATLSADSGSISLRWPTNAVGFTLMQTPNVPPSAWSAVTNVPAVSDTNFSVTLPSFSSQE